MMGRTHVITGAATWLVAAALLHPVDHLSFTNIAFGSVLGAGAAVICDIDHPNAGITQTFGAITRSFSWLVRKTSGGHRHGTHSFFGAGVFAFVAFLALALHTGQLRPAYIGAAVFCVLAGLGALVAAFGDKRRPAYKHPWHGPAAVIFTGLTVAVFTVAALTEGRIVGSLLLGALVTLVMAAAIWPLKIEGKWDDFAPIPITILLVFHRIDLHAVGIPVAFASPFHSLLHVSLGVVPYAVLTGVLTHLAGDCPTPEGIPWGWPWTGQNYSMGGWLEVDGWFENGPITITALLALAAAGAWNGALVLGLA